MEDERLTRLLHRFATTAKMHFQSMEMMNEERAAVHAQVIAGLHRSISGFGEPGRLALLAMVDDADPVVAGMAAVYSLRFDSARAVAALRRVAEEPGLLGFRARVAVDRWESGEWKGPEE